MMLQTLSKVGGILEPYIPTSLIGSIKTWKQNLDYEDWLRKNKFVPPPHKVKQLAIQEYQDTYNLGLLVETGTFRGDMVYAQLNYFKSIISIEVDEHLCKTAQKRFKNNSKVNILFGDSGEVLQTLVPSLRERTLFWLDGHFSGGITSYGKLMCPIYKELDAIMISSLKHIVLIDDARLFNGRDDYPTLLDFSAYVNQKGRYTMAVQDDIIRLT